MVSVAHSGSYAYVVAVGSVSASVHQGVAWRNGDGPGGKAGEVVGNI